MHGLEAWMCRSERWMYRSGHPNRVAALLNRGWAVVGAIGLWRNRLVTLEVRGHLSGRLISFPLVVADYQSERFLVAMLGERAKWVTNVRAAGGHVVLRHGQRQAVRLEEVEPRARAPIIRRHLEVAPAARSFIPVDRRAPLAEFERIAPQVPVFRIRPVHAAASELPRSHQGGGEMIRQAGLETPTVLVSTRPPRRLRRRGWVLAVGALLLVLAVVAVLSVGAFVGLSGAPSLALPAAAASAPVGPLEGTWDVAAGSVAGFRIEQTVLGMSGDVVGRTTTVSGTLVVADDRIANATFSIDLTAITVDGKAPPQLALSIDTQAHPNATFTLTQPVPLDSRFASGETVAATATGELTLNGTSHSATFTISGRRDGDTLQAVGTVPVAFADWGIEGPQGYGALGSLADHGVAEFVVILHRTDTGRAG